LKHGCSDTDEHSYFLAIRDILDKKELVKTLISSLPELLMVNSVLVKIRDGNGIIYGRNFRKHAGGPIDWELGTIDDITFDDLTENLEGIDRIVIRDEIEKRREIGRVVDENNLMLLESMKSENYAALVPVQNEYISEGYIAVGYKLSGDMFSAYDIQFMELLRKSMNQAMKNISNINLIKQQQQEIEREIQKANHLESVGFLAAGVAHDFNNILTSILGNISLLEGKTKTEGENFEIIKDTMLAINKAKALTGQLLTFSQGEQPMKHLTSIEKVVRSSADFALRGSHCRYSLFVDEDVWPVEIDEFQIGQVIDNMVINASQAMKDGGTIEINIKNTVISGSNNPVLDKGKYVRIDIKDSGTGIAPEYINKVFDIYFTTKKSGSGLGLATAYSIIKKHGGHIKVESRLGEGTTFHIFIPAANEQEIGPEHEKKDIIKGTGRVLLVDDKAEILKTTGRMLRSLGYEHETGSSGFEAIEIYQKAVSEDKPFDCVILDLTLAGSIGGEIVMKKITDIDRSAKVIASSGYANKEILSNFKKYDFKGVLYKPYDISELSIALHNLLKKT